MRRLLRESYRLNKIDLLEYAIQKKKQLKIIFTLTYTGYNNFRQLKFDVLKMEVFRILEKILNFLHKND